MKINIISTNHNSKKPNFFNFKLSDLEYLGKRSWTNKVFKCWYQTKYVNIILWDYSSFKNIRDEGHGRSVNNNIIFKEGEHLTFTYDENDYSEWKSTVNKNLLKYKNIHENDICVLLGSGPSLKQYKKIDNAVHFGVNHINKLVDYDIDYYFLNDWVGVKKDSSVLNFKVNKMRFYSYYKKKSNFIEYGEGIYPKYKKELDNSKLPYEYIECVTRRDTNIKKFKWFKNIEKYGLGSSINSMIRIFQLALYMGFKHIIIVGCDCSDTYKRVLKLWKHAFNESNKLYPKVNIFIYNPVNLKLKPEFNLNNIFILEKIDNSSFYFNKYLMDCLFNHSIWDNTTLYDINNNKIVLKYHNDILGIGSYSRNIDDIRIIKLDNASLKRELNIILFKKFNNDLILNDELQFFNNIQLFTNIKTYKRSKYINNKLLTINKNKEKHSHIIDITINNEYVLITNNSIELRFYISNCNEKKILLISHILKILKTKYSFTLC